MTDCADIEEKIQVTRVETAKDGEGITATHSCKRHIL
jgi:hypothetical protein